MQFGTDETKPCENNSYNTDELRYSTLYKVLDRIEIIFLILNFFVFCNIFAMVLESSSNAKG